MGNLPQIDTPIRFPIEIQTPSYLGDHLFQGQPVLPAVEAMETLAGEVKKIHPDCRVTHISDARFDKFLSVDPEKNDIPALLDLQVRETGDLHAALITRAKAPKATITRTKTHAQLIFLQSEPAFAPLPLDIAAAIEGICTRVAANRIYQDLVPFGRAYRNLQDTVRLSPDGALAEIHSPALPCGITTNFLGSPFVLDAAFHAACVWAQHYQDIVAFPVGIEQRSILYPTEPGKRYFARILPRSLSQELLRFDIWLLDEVGHLCEMVQGVQMRDVSGGRLEPPGWIKPNNPEDPLANLRSRCEAMAIVELDAVAPFAGKTLSLRENERFDKMGPQRRKSFLAGRLALKRLFRGLQNTPRELPPQEIETVCADSTKPCCVHEDLPSRFYCSVSHNHRFAVAVLAPEPIGVDVEIISDKALKCSRLYMSYSEQQSVIQSGLGEKEAALRVWSTKEAVAKATGMDLAHAWQKVQLLTIGDSESRFSIDGIGDFTATHASADKHLFTLFELRT